MNLSEISPTIYRSFVRALYRDDSTFKDNKSGIYPFLLDSAVFSKNACRRLVAVEEDGVIFCACLLLIHQNAPTLLSVALFESLPDCEKAVSLLLQDARKWGRKKGCKQMVVGLDGHVNYNVGFSYPHKSPTFGESYNPVYYHDYLKTFSPVKLVSFGDNMADVQKRILKDMAKYEKRLSSFSLETPGFSSRFDDTLHRFTDLNNQIFSEQPFYFPRKYEEDKELFATMRPLLQKNNLIFARYKGKDVGFILWYPDYNELVPPKKGAGLSTFVQYKLFHKTPAAIKVVEIGVLSHYRHYGVILLLLHQAMESTKNTESITSSWIFDQNTPSKALTTRYLTNLQKEYIVYEEAL